MRLWIAALVLSSIAFAQHRGGFGRGGGFRGGFGRPGIIGGTLRPGFGHFGVRPGFPKGFGGTVFRGRFGSSFHRGGFRGGGFGFGFGGGTFFPAYSGFPLYSSLVPYQPLFGDWYSMAQPYTSPTVVIIGGGQQEDPEPSGRVVVINNTLVRPWRQQDYRVEPRAAEAESGPIVYLIALKDGRAWAAVAYWVDGSTLHLVTRRNEQMSFPLDQVDRSFSERLNRERGVRFRLP